MLRKTRSVEVQGDIEIDVNSFTDDEIYDIRESARKIIRVCGLVPEEFDRALVKKQAEYILSSTETR